MTDDSWAANQIRTEPIPPTPAHDETPSTGSDQPDTASDGPAPPAVEGAQAGLPEAGVTDLRPAPGTSEELPPVQGVYLPDVGPGGADTDTADRPLPGRTTDSR